LEMAIPGEKLPRITRPKGLRIAAQWTYSRHLGRRWLPLGTEGILLRTNFTCLQCHTALVTKCVVLNTRTGIVRPPRPHSSMHAISSSKTAAFNSTILSPSDPQDRRTRETRFRFLKSVAPRLPRCAPMSKPSIVYTFLDNVVSAQL
jgi:hypothetical protein